MNIRLRLIALLALFSSTLSAQNFASFQDNLIINNKTEWRYYAKIEKPPKTWFYQSYDDSDWKSGHAGFGYGDEDDITLLNDMYGNYDKVYIRTTFKHNKRDDQLYLYMYYDDAFIAYINGVEVARADINTKNEISTTVDPKDERFKIKLPFSSDNTYTLAIVGFNRHKKSSDFSLLPWLGKHYLSSAERAWLRHPDLLSKQQAKEDIELLQFYLQDRASYLTRYEHDIIAELDKQAEQLPAQITTLKFANILNRVILTMGDCHYKMTPSPKIRQNKGNLPFRLARTNNGWVALNDKSEGLLNDAFPLVKAIDGIALSEYKEAAKHYVKACSEQMVDRRTSIYLQDYFPIVKQGLAKFDKSTDNQNIHVTLGRTIDNKTTTLQLPLSNSRVGRAKIALPNTQILENNIGYLRIKAMNKEVDKIHEAMWQFKDSQGLIIDIRNNGGGTYHILDAIYGYFLPANDPGKIINVAAVRKSDAFESDHLDYRKTFVETNEYWSDAQREIIKKFKQTFVPKWKFSRANFTQWHYRFAQPSSTKQYFYNKPIIVLTNAGSASASDGFANALGLLPQVTLIGEPTAGMSGANRSVMLKHSKLKLNLSSMASFQPNGELFEGNGVEVDITKLPTSSDYVKGSDSVLSFAQELLLE